ncbi:MAG: hypothetical protein FJ206_10885 [Gemmatimonadetes bacterium]|nr:hypothetical protein [Gemmatimonadota bacterium]
MTLAPSLVSLFIGPLNRAGIEYVVTGGLAAVVYGHPRLTLDVDLVLRLSPSALPTFAGLWPEEAYYCPPLEVLALERERTRHGHFNLIHLATGMRADVYLSGEDEFHAWALERAVVRQVEDQPVRFAPIEYVIAYKLLFFQSGGSDRHLRDVARMIEISGSAVDQSALAGWIGRLGLEVEWSKAGLYVGRE